MRRSAILPLILAALSGGISAPASSQVRPLGDSVLLGNAPAPFVAVSVADLDRIVAWYRDTLGFRVHSQGTIPGGKIRFALLQQGNTLVEVLKLPDSKPRNKAAPGYGEAQIHGFFKSGFVVADIDQVYAAIRQQGVSIPYEIVRPPDGPYRTFGIRDPEGNLIQFFGR